MVKQGFVQVKGVPSLVKHLVEPDLFKVKGAGLFDLEWAKLGSVQVKGVHSFDP